MHFLTPFILCLLSRKIYAFSLSELITANITHTSASVSQQNLAVAPPFPILQVALEHILSQWGENATEAENATIAAALSATPRLTRRSDLSTFVSLRERDAAAQCSPTSPCADESCCNSEGKCGFTPYNCKNTATTTCISNCDATAMCGVDSFHGEQKCPLNICCSYFGYCGVNQSFPILQ
jgi:chitinase